MVAQRPRPGRDGLRPWERVGTTTAAPRGAGIMGEGGETAEGGTTTETTWVVPGAKPRKGVGGKEKEKEKV